MATIAFLAAIGSAQAQSAPEGPQEALSILQKTSQHYVDLRTYKIVQEETFTSEHPPDPAPTTMTAIEAPGGRYRFEGDMGHSNAMLVSDGHFIWFYRSSQNAFTQRAVNEEDTAPANSLFPDETAVMGVMGASHLREMALFVADYKSALRLSDANLMLAACGATSQFWAAPASRSAS